MPLTETERNMLDFELLWWAHTGSKERAIRDRFDMSAIRYHQILYRLIWREEALAYQPVVVKSLQRRRHERRVA